MIVIGPWTVKSMPGQFMSDDELRTQVKLVSELAEVMESVTEQDEVMRRVGKA